MKAVRVGTPRGIETLALVELPDPGSPGPGELRLRVQASSLNFHDYGVVKGAMRAADGRIPMADGAGIVEAVGAGVTGYAPGDSFVSAFFPTWEDGEAPIAGFAETPGDGVDGFAREFAVVPESWVTRGPAGWSPAEAATITTAGLTAWRALAVEGGLKAGESVLVMGTGGVSIYALQIAKAFGATVIATSSSDEKMARLTALGADHVLNYRQNENWGETVRGLTGGRGVDHVVEVGGAGTLAQSIQAGRIGGHISMIGVLTGGVGTVPTAALMIRQQCLKGIVVGSRTHQRQFVQWLERSAVRPIIDRHFSLAELGAAFAHEESGRHFGKIVVDL